jgi:peptidase E
MKAVLAGGGWPYSEKEALPFVRRAMEISGATRPKLLVVPTGPSSEKTFNGDVEGLRKIFGSKPADKTRFEVLHGFRETPDYDHTIELMEWADTVFITGGNTTEVIDRWHRSGIDQLMLKAAVDESASFIGISAGLICWFTYGWTDTGPWTRPEPKQARFRTLPCLGHFNAWPAPTTTPSMPSHMSHGQKASAAESRGSPPALSASASPTTLRSRSAAPPSASSTTTYAPSFTSSRATKLASRSTVSMPAKARSRSHSYSPPDPAWPPAEHLHPTRQRTPASATTGGVQAPPQLSAPTRAPRPRLDHKKNPEAAKAFGVFLWRRGRDSNSRGGLLPPTGLANPPLQPLGYLSVPGAELGGTSLLYRARGFCSRGQGSHQRPTITHSPPKARLLYRSLYAKVETQSQQIPICNDTLTPTPTPAVSIRISS